MGKNGIGEVRQTGLSVTREAVSVRCNQKAEKTWNLSFIKKSPCVRDGGPPSEDCASIFSMQGDSKCLVEPASFERRWFPSASSNRRAQRVPGGYGRWAPAPANCFSNQWEELKALCLTLRVGVEESTCFGFIIGSSSFTCCGRSSNAALSKTGRDSQIKSCSAMQPPTADPNVCRATATTSLASTVFGATTIIGPRWEEAPPQIRLVRTSFGDGQFWPKPLVRRLGSMGSTRSPLSSVAICLAVAASTSNPSQSRDCASREGLGSVTHGDEGEGEWRTAVL